MAYCQCIRGARAMAAYYVRGLHCTGERKEGKGKKVIAFYVELCVVDDHSLCDGR